MNTDGTNAAKSHLGLALSMVLSSALLVGCSNLIPTDFNKGHSSGVASCREAKSSGGIALATFNAAAYELGATSIGIDPLFTGKSADWIAGFKAGYREELGK